MSSTLHLNCLSNATEVNESICEETRQQGELPGPMYVVLAVYLFFLTIFGILVNGAVIYLYFSRRETATVSNMYIVALCLCGFLIATLGIPFAAASSIRHHWLFGDGICKLHGFLLTGLGIVMIALLTGIAIDKYIHIVWYQAHRKVTKSFALGIITLCYVYGVIWGILPLFGWNKYVLEPARLTCSVEWTGDFSNHSYAITILFTGLLIPVGVIASLYSSILKKVSRNSSTFILIGKLLLSKFIIFKRKLCLFFSKFGLFLIYPDHVTITHLLTVGCV